MQDQRPGARFKYAYNIVNLREYKFSTLYKKNTSFNVWGRCFVWNFKAPFKISLKISQHTERLTRKLHVKNPCQFTRILRYHFCLAGSTPTSQSTARFQISCKYGLWHGISIINTVIPHIAPNSGNWLSWWSGYRAAFKHLMIFND